MQLKYDPISRAPSSLDGNIRSTVFRIYFLLPRPTFIFIPVHHVDELEYICWNVVHLDCNLGSDTRIAGSFLVSTTCCCSPLQQSSTVRLQRGHFSLPCTYIVRVHSPQCGQSIGSLMIRPLGIQTWTHFHLDAKLFG